MAVIRSIRGGTAGLNEEERLTIARLLIKAGYSVKIGYRVIPGNTKGKKEYIVSKYRFRIITKAKQFFLYKDIYFARDKEVEIPKDLQKRIVEVIEDWVDEKVQELKNI